MTNADRIDLLRTLSRVVSEGSLNRAAGRLGVSQPSVSRRLKQLEDLVGARLVHRTTHDLSVTDEGRRLLLAAADIVGRWEAALDEVRDDEPQGLLRVAAPVGLGQAALVDAAAAFLAAHPKVELDWRLTDGAVDLMAGEADVWIKIGAVADDRLAVRRLARVERLIVADGTLVARAADWRGLPLIALTPFHAGFVELVDADGGVHRHEPRVAMRTDNIEAVRRAARQGAGVAVLPRWMVADDLDAGRLVDAAAPLRAPSLDVTLAFAPERGRPKRLRTFVEAMSAAFSHEGGGPIR
ncbi:MAG: LysR family transcriptional regulator [Parvularculaceae bacterium]